MKHHLHEHRKFLPIATCACLVLGTITFFFVRGVTADLQQASAHKAQIESALSQ